MERGGELEASGADEGWEGVRWEEEEFGDFGIGEEVEVEEGESGAAWFWEGMEEGGEVGEDFGWSGERERGMGRGSGRGWGGEFAKVLDVQSVG